MKEIHELAKLFPPMAGEDFKALCKDVKDHGLLNSIVLYEGKVLDGRNRERACNEVGVRPRYETFTDGSALEYVISQNVQRRHLTADQRALLALDLEKLFAEEIEANRKAGIKSKNSTGDHNANRKDWAVKKAASALHTSEWSVQYAKRLKKDHPEKVAAVRAGKISVKEAFLEARDTRVTALVARQKERAAKKRQQKVTRQVADYTDAMKLYAVALKLAEGDAELFSPEAARFVLRRHDQIRKLMSTLEDALNKK